MANTWFSSDYHLGHFNIIRYCNRPFKTLFEMNEAIIANHNMRVKPEDTLFMVGDFCFRNSPGGKEGEGEIYKFDYYRARLNGNIVFIKGNHDNNNSTKTPIEKVVIRYGGQRICMVHNPIHADSSYPINFVGHVHGAWIIKELDATWKSTQLNEKSIMYNVGVDVNNFRPVAYEEIWSNIQKWKKIKKAE